MYLHIFNGTVETELDAVEWKSAMVDALKDENEKGTFVITKTEEIPDEEDDDEDESSDEEGPQT